MLPKQTAERYLLSSSPHAHGPRTVSSLMLDVIVALLPAFGCAIFFFGLRALFLAGTCIAATCRRTCRSGWPPQAACSR